MQVIIRVTEADPTPDKFSWVGRYHRGDVIQVLPDSHIFSERERTNKAWRILNIPELTKSEALALEMPEENPGEIKLRTWRRVRKLDLDHISISRETKDFLADDSRKASVLTLTDGRTLLNNIVVLKPVADIV